jgi:hypothetical protein
MWFGHPVEVAPCHRPKETFRLYKMGSNFLVKPSLLSRNSRLSRAKLQLDIIRAQSRCWRTIPPLSEKLLIRAPQIHVDMLSYGMILELSGKWQPLLAAQKTACLLILGRISCQERLLLKTSSPKWRRNSKCFYKPFLINRKSIWSLTPRSASEEVPAWPTQNPVQLQW